jgi:hypothetical protein
VRVTWDPRKQEYLGHVRDPYVRRLSVTFPRRGRGSPTTPEAYDEAARVALAWASRKNRRLMLQRRRGRIVVSRMFVSPCPVGRTW